MKLCSTMTESTWTKAQTLLIAINQHVTGFVGDWLVCNMYVTCSMYAQRHEIQWNPDRKCIYVTLKCFDYAKNAIAIEWTASS